MADMPNMPPIDCPDCDGKLQLQPMPPHFRGKKRWVYLCENRPRCRGLLSAHPNGEPVGEPVPQDVRTARRHCHAVFDRLWGDADQMYDIRETSGNARRRAIWKIKKTARIRAYEFIADRLGMTEEDCHIGKITDLRTLRRFYAEAKDASPEEIRRWAKARREAA